MHKLKEGEDSEFRTRADGTLEFQGRRYVPRDLVL